MKRTVLLLTLLVLLASALVCHAEGDKKFYDRAYSLYEKKSYYEAHELFVQSQYGDWERMSKKCIRRWPADGEIWHDPTQWLRDTELTFRVEQPNDTAIFLTVFKDNSPVSKVFIGGDGEVTVMLPGNGNYSIRDGVGSNWYGEEDMFGADGAYETMTFEPNDNDYYYFKQKLSYLVTINIDDVAGEDIGSEDLDWKEFMK